MSYDIWVEMEVSCSINHTGNTAPMWEKALGFPLKNLEGWKCREAMPYLNEAIENMENNRGEYMPLNPENGWGNYDSALKYLKDVKSLCEDFPMGTIRMSI